MSRSLDTFFEVHRVAGGWAVRGAPECWRGAARDSGGVYAGWSWDGERLVVSNDRYGMFPLFYSQTAERLMISHSLERLLAEGADSRLDDDALAVFVGLGWFVGEDTPFAEIRAVPPAARFIWQAGRLEVAGSYARSAPREWTWDAAVDAYIELFRQAMDRASAATGRIVLPLSGGKDSRHILLALHEASHLPELCVTFRQLPWQESNLDVGIAAELSTRLGIPHVVLDQPRNALRAERRKNRMTHYCSDEHAHYVTLVDYLRDEQATLYDGIAGDILSESKGRGLRPLELFADGKLREIARMELGSIPHLQRLLTREAFDRFHPERALTRLEKELSLHRDAANPFGSYRFWTRTRREIALSPYAMLGEHEIHAPFLDPDLFDFFTSLPAPLILGKNRLHTTVIRRAYPEFADLPFDHERRSLAADQLEVYAGQSRAGAFSRHLRSSLWIGAAAAYAAGSPHNTLVERGYVVARTLRSLARDIEKDEAAPWLARMTTYLVQLQEVAGRPARRRVAGAGDSSS